MIKAASCFTQILNLIDRPTFARIVFEHHAERCAKGFSSWEQLTSMLFAQLSGANSLREIEGGLASAGGKLVHLNMRRSPSRSTLSYANAHRPWQVYQLGLPPFGGHSVKPERIDGAHIRPGKDTPAMNACARYYRTLRCIRKSNGEPPLSWNTLPVEPAPSSVCS
jgi:hypothetical protein